MTADIGREAVYAAEIAAFEGTSYESTVPFEQLAEMARSVTTSGWWPHGTTEVVLARSDASSSTTRQRGADAPVVRLAAPQMTPATLAHELAHVLAGVAHGHDPVFRRAHVDLTASLLDAEAATWLAEAYSSMHLELGRRAWPEPPVTASSVAL